MFPSLPVSTLYGTVFITLFDDAFKFAVIKDHLLLKRNGIYIHCVNGIFFFLVRFLLYIVDCYASCTPTNLSEMVHLVTLCTFLSMYWASSGLLAGSTVLAILFDGDFERYAVFSHFSIVHLLLLVPCQILSSHSGCLWLLTRLFGP